jgi:hypothetical protein
MTVNYERLFSFVIVKWREWAYIMDIYPTWIAPLPEIFVSLAPHQSITVGHL